MLGNLSEKVITDLTILLARDDLLGLISNIASNATNKFERNMSGKGVVWEKDLLYLFWMKIWILLKS